MPRGLAKQLLKRKDTRSKIGPPKCKGSTCELLTVGALVPIPLDMPRGIVKGERLVGEFRAGDIRYEAKPRKIEQVYINPGQPPMYRVTGLRNVAYTKEELQVLPKNEVGRMAKTPPKKKVRQFFTVNYKGKVQRLVREFKAAGRTNFEVKWKGLPATENTNVPMKELYYVKYNKRGGKVNFGFGKTKKQIKANVDKMIAKLRGKKGKK